MEQPQHHAWVNRKATRYYEVHLTRDLFGNWTLRKVWGGIGSRLGGMRHTGVASYEDGIDQVREISRRRNQRGYQRVGVPQYQ
jgi:hypothetical protein